MIIDCPIRQALERIAPHLETLEPIDRELLRPAVRAVENDVEVVHVPEHCDDGNLKALCQRCHLAYDAQHHAETARTTRRSRKAIGDLFEV